ncbi:Uncharacterised protein [Bordetella pertussis]|nr:Uncharacterised protein [Bordetella pertussis]
MRRVAGQSAAAAPGMTRILLRVAMAPDAWA